MPSGTHLNQTKLDLLTCDSEGQDPPCVTLEGLSEIVYKGFIGFGFGLGDLRGDEESRELPWNGCS